MTIGPGFLLEKNLTGGGGGGQKTTDHCFLKTIDYCSYCYFYCFLKILGAKVVLGGAPCSRKPGSLVVVQVSKLSSGYSGETFLALCARMKRLQRKITQGYYWIGAK